MDNSFYDPMPEKDLADFCRRQGIRKAFDVIIDLQKRSAGTSGMISRETFRALLTLYQHECIFQEESERLFHGLSVQDREKEKILHMKFA